jgi:hypothetical protein
MPLTHIYDRALIFLGLVQGYYFTIIAFWWGQCMFVSTQWKYIFILFQSCELCIHDIPLIFWKKYGIPLHLLISNKCGCLSVILFNKTLHVLTFWKYRRVRDVAIYWLIVYCLTSSITAILRTSASSTIYRTTIYIYRNESQRRHQPLTATEKAWGVRLFLEVYNRGM